MHIYRYQVSIGVRHLENELCLKPSHEPIDANYPVQERPRKLAWILSIGVTASIPRLIHLKKTSTLTMRTRERFPDKPNAQRVISLGWNCCGPTPLVINLQNHRDSLCSKFLEFVQINLSHPKTIFFLGCYRRIISISSDTICIGWDCPLFFQKRLLTWLNL